MDNQTQNLTKQERRELKKAIREQGQKVNERRRTIKKWSVRGVITLIVIGAGFGLWKLATLPPSPALQNILEVQSDDWAKGNKDAPVTLIEYLDFECEACGAYDPVVKKLQNEFSNDLLVVIRYFPLPGHKNSMTAALAAEAAGRQGKFWEMHDALFENQKSWGEKSAPDPELFIGYAEKIGLDIEQFNQDRENKSPKVRIERDKTSGNQLKVQGTPTFFLNGEKIQLPRSYEEFKTLIETASKKATKK